jgi:hypothetical protein
MLGTDFHPSDIIQMPADQICSEAQKVERRNFFHSHRRSILLKMFSSYAMLVPLLGSCYSACQTFSGSLTRLNPNNGDCIIVSGAFFYETVDVIGGAICISSRSLTVQMSTFLRCSATYGGAIDDTGTGLVLDRSCISDSSCKSSGTAIDIWEGSGEKTINDTECNLVAGSSLGV